MPPKRTFSRLASCTVSRLAKSSDCACLSGRLLLAQHSAAATRISLTRRAGGGNITGKKAFPRASCRPPFVFRRLKRCSGVFLAPSGDYDRRAVLGSVTCARRAYMTTETTSKALQDIEDAHQAACDAGVSRYIDPSTGYKVFTRRAHENRGFCCGNACRHCPFGHMDVIPEYRPADSVPRTALLAQFRKGKKSKLTVGNAWKSFKDEGPLREVLFWSGGKDSLLALRALQQDQRETGCEVKITLLTTYDGDTGNIPFQDTKVTDVLQQAKREGFDILTIPLKLSATTPKGARNIPKHDTKHYEPESYAKTVLAALKPLRVKSLAFGDLHLQDLRQWREAAFSGGTGGYPCRFPIFGVPHDQLLSRLWAENGITVKVSHVSPEVMSTQSEAEGTKLAVGDVFQSSFVSRLPEGVDVMGENGEFHTHVYHHEEVRKRRGVRAAASSAGSADSDSSSRSSSSK